MKGYLLNKFDEAINKRDTKTLRDILEQVYVDEASILQVLRDAGE